MLPLSFLCLILAGAGLRPAMADMYGFIDENGRAHISTIRLDERYSLFQKTPPKTPSVAEVPLPFIDAAARKRYARVVGKAAQAYRVEEALLHAVISAESAYDPAAVSPRGAMGLMQIMPETAERYGARDAYDPEQNVRAGAQYLRDLMRMFNNDVSLVLAAYNAGHNAVRRFGDRIPPYPQTLTYVPRAMAFYRRYQDKI